jgi:hypothetical protein
MAKNWARSLHGEALCDADRETRQDLSFDEAIFNLGGGTESQRNWRTT